MSESTDLSAGHDTPVIAAIDLGSNSFHLMIARVVEGTLQPVSKQKLAVQLASGLDHHNRLSETAIERGLSALQSFAVALSGFDPRNVRIVATYTLRKAVNAQQFLDKANAFLDYPIEIISGEEEARFIYDGVAHTVSESDRKLVVDIGGGSTEVIIGENFEPQQLRSINMGCVTFTRDYFAHGAITDVAMERAYQSAMERLSLCAPVFKAKGWDSAIGCSGTIKAVLILLRHLSIDEHQIHRSSLSTLRDTLVSREHHDNLSEFMLSEARAKTIAAGTAILTAVFDTFGIESMIVSDAALREGVLYAMDSRLHNIDIRKRSIDGIAKRYYVDHEQANRVKSTVVTLLKNLLSSDNGYYSEANMLVTSAALVHEIGVHIHTRGYHNHSAYIISHSDLPGFTQPQLNTLRWLLKHCRKRLNKMMPLPTSTIPETVLVPLCLILRLSIILNQKRQDNLLTHVAVSIEDKRIRLSLPEGWLNDKSVIETALQRECEYLETVDYSLMIVYVSEKHS